MIAAVFEAKMSRAQANRLVQLMEEGRPTRPEGVISTALTVDGDDVQLVAYWRDRATFDHYVATVPAPRGTELMRKVGVEPTLRVVETLQLG
jgi:hypothetical protein